MTGICTIIIREREGGSLMQGENQVGDPLGEGYLSKQLDFAQNSTLQRPGSNHAISQYQHLSMDSPVIHTARRMSSSSIDCRCKFGIQSKQEAKQDSNRSQKPHNFTNNERNSRNKCQ